MTDEAHGDTPEEAPAPPTSTRWSEDAVAEDDAPPPPFVPGRRDPSAPATPAADQDTAEPDTGEVTAESQEAPAEGKPFPFELPVESEAEAPAGSDSADDDFPTDQFDIEGRGEAPRQPVEPEPPATAEPEMAGSWSPADMLEEERDEGAVPEPEAAGGAEAPPTPTAPPAEGAVEDVAAVLDRLSGKLRSGGEAALRRELDSPDRLTAVLAAILAGHLSARP